MIEKGIVTKHTYDLTETNVDILKRAGSRAAEKTAQSS